MDFYHLALISVYQLKSRDLFLKVEAISLRPLGEWGLENAGLLGLWYLQSF